MNLNKISTKDLVCELSRRNQTQTIDVFQNVGYKVRIPFKVIKNKGPVTILIIKE